MNLLTAIYFVPLNELSRWKSKDLPQWKDVFLRKRSHLKGTTNTNLSGIHSGTSVSPKEGAQGAEAWAPSGKSTVISHQGRWGEESIAERPKLEKSSSYFGRHFIGDGHEDDNIATWSYYVDLNRTCTENGENSFHFKSKPVNFWAQKGPSLKCQSSPTLSLIFSPGN